MDGHEKAREETIESPSFGLEVEHTPVIHDGHYEKIPSEIVQRAYRETLWALAGVRQRQVPKTFADRLGSGELIGVEAGSGSDYPSIGQPQPETLRLYELIGPDLEVHGVRELHEE